MLEKEYDYFVSIREKLIKEHHGEFVAILNEEILGFYPTEEVALQATSDHELGTVLIQQCIPENEIIQEYHTRAVFS